MSKPQTVIDEFTFPSPLMVIMIAWIRPNSYNSGYLTGHSVSSNGNYWRRFVRLLSWCKKCTSLTNILVNCRTSSSTKSLILPASAWLMRLAWPKQCSSYSSTPLTLFCLLLPRKAWSGADDLYVTFVVTRWCGRKRTKVAILLWRAQHFSVHKVRHHRLRNRLGSEEDFSASESRVDILRRSVARF